MSSRQEADKRARQLIRNAAAEWELPQKDKRSRAARRLGKRLIDCGWCGESFDPRRTEAKKSDGVWDQRQDGRRVFILGGPSEHGEQPGDYAFCSERCEKSMSRNAEHI